MGKIFIFKKKKRDLKKKTLIPCLKLLKCLPSSDDADSKSRDVGERWRSTVQAQMASGAGATVAAHVLCGEESKLSEELT